MLAPFTHTEIIACTADWTSFLQWTSEPDADPALANLGHSIMGATRRRRVQKSIGASSARVRRGSSLVDPLLG
jgi:hypothetical protein